jgi:hypothetical protein
MHLAIALYSHKMKRPLTPERTAYSLRWEFIGAMGASGISKEY